MKWWFRQSSLDALSSLVSAENLEKLKTHMTQLKTELNALWEKENQEKGVKTANAAGQAMTHCIRKCIPRFCQENDFVKCVPKELEKNAATIHMRLEMMFKSALGEDEKLLGKVLKALRVGVSKTQVAVASLAVIGVVGAALAVGVANNERARVAISDFASRAKAALQELPAHIRNLPVYGRELWKKAATFARETGTPALRRAVKDANKARKALMEIMKGVLASVKEKYNLSAKWIKRNRTHLAASLRASAAKTHLRVRGSLNLLANLLAPKDPVN